ncbi:HTTM domain-containing protein [Kitasatospora xanthocidica]|uniref:HTTM domain-containing protein n=1 Tax=Kitasatospora xanthocidica TaxID=83382 RepID=UPI00167960D1|nr:HTTM domain-containing protein [Kitasatospora xanthocidica]GHF29951.1 HTTM domain-containing protein [Kitasatospora xanthocidica]
MNEVSLPAARPDGDGPLDGVEPAAGVEPSGGAVPPPRVPRQAGAGPDAAAPRGPGATELLGRAVDAFTGRVLGRHQAAVVRIGFGLVWLAHLLREWPNRRVLYGDRSPWSMELAERLLGDDGAFTVLTWFGGRFWFELVYHLAVLAALGVLLGWRTRASTVLFLVTVLSLQNRDVFLGDGGDNVVHLMAVYLVFTRCAEVWSLDARRARSGRGGRAGAVLWAVLGAVLAVCQFGGFSGTNLSWTGRTFPHLGWAPLFWGLWAVAGLWWVLGRLRPDGEPRAVLDALATMVHNCAMLVIAVEVVLIYATAGWYKVQGSRWQDGTALYYPLHLDYFTPWPGLSALVGSALLPVFLISYGTVMVQVAFPFTLLNRRVKNVLLAVMMLEHAGIAVVLGLPVFSLAMIAADAVFLPTGALLRLAAWASRLAARASRIRTGRIRRRPAP